MNKDLAIQDPEIYELLSKEFNRQKEGIELIASENFTSKPVLSLLGSVLTNKYSEGRPGKRYYGGNQFIDKIELLCEKRALEAFRLSPEDWSVNVQPLSGCSANFEVYTAILNPHDRIMGLDLPSGGHLSHGFYLGSKKVSATSIYFESLPYTIKSDGYIDYDDLEKKANLFRPKLIICGASAYPRDLDYKKFRQIADNIGAYLMCDMAHISGLVAAQEMNNPFEYCDIVTSTTHKTLRGPRSGMIFSKNKDNIPQKINDAVFPGLQGGPHDNQIGALAAQLKEVNSNEFKEYIQQVKRNAKALASKLIELGYEVSTDGTDNHIVLFSLKNKGITGSKMEKVCEAVDMSVNKNTIYGDKNPMNPSGVRLGTSAMTTRGFKEKEFENVALLLDRCANIAITIQEKHGKMLRDFVLGLENNEEIEKIKLDVNSIASKYEFYSSY